MKKILMVILGVVFVTSGSLAKGISKRKPNSSFLELDEAASKVVGNLVRKANHGGDKNIKFEGGPQVTAYSVGNLECYFQNSDDSVSCSVRGK